MTFKALTLKITPLLMLIFIAPMGTGCGKYSKRLKRKLGLRSQSIKMTDLGKSYKKYKGSEFDVFSFSSKVRKKTKRKPINVNYHTFKLKGIDGFLKSANVVYAQYRFANATTDRFHKNLRAALGKKFYKMSAREISSAIRKRNSSKIKTIRRLKSAFKAFKLALKASKDIVSQSQKLVDQSSSLINKGKKSLLAHPDRALLAPEMLKETKRTLGRLKDVISGTPKLVKKMYKTKDIIPLLDKIW